MNLKTIAIASFVVGVIHFNIGPWQGMLWAKLAIELVAIVLLGVLYGRVSKQQGAVVPPPSERLN